MNTSAISFNAKTAFYFQPSVILHSILKKTSKNNSYSPLLPAKLENHTAQVAYILAQEIRNPIGHINISVEMLESMIEDNDLKMYLDVIKRNSIRINHLINKFLKYQQMDEPLHTEEKS